MKVRNVCLVLGMILAVAGTANALTLKNWSPGETLYFKLVGHTQGIQYNAGIAFPGVVGEGALDNPALVATPCLGRQFVETLPGSGQWKWEDTWSIATVSSIVNEVDNKTFWERSDFNTELTMLIYGGVDVEAVAYPGLTTTSSNFIKAVVYEDDDVSDLDGTLRFNPNLGAGGRTGPMTYTSVTDGTKILELVAPNYNTGSVTGAPMTVAQNNAVFGNFVSGTGSAYFNVQDVDGNPADNGRDELQFDTDGITFGLPPGVTTDFLASWTVNPPTNGDFIARINDPIQGNAQIPEPMTMLAVFGSMVGLGGYVRKRKRG